MATGVGMWSDLGATGAVGRSPKRKLCGVCRYFESDINGMEIRMAGPPWEIDAEAFEARCKSLSQQHMDGWHHDWGRSVDDFMQQLHLSRTDALLYLVLQQVAHLGVMYHQIAEFQQRMGPRTERLLKLMEHEADEMEKGDDWKSDD